MTTHTIDTLTSEAQLRAALHITEHDISENRWGRLSWAQKKRLAFDEMLLSGILLGFSLALAWPLTRIDLRAGLGRDAVLVIWLLLLMGLLSLVLWQFRRAAMILSKGDVHSVRARFKRSVFTGSPYVIAIPEHQFTVNRAVYEALADQTDYTFYYVPALNRLVAVESKTGVTHG